MKKTVADIKKFIGNENCLVVGDIKKEFQYVRPINEAQAGDLTFCAKSGEEALQLLKSTRASVIICEVNTIPKDVTFDNKTLVAVNKPRLWFIRCVRTFFLPKKKIGIHSTVIIGKNSKVSKNVYIGPYVTIGDDVAIGSGTTIQAGVHIHDRVRIGKNVIIKSGCIIGGDGFGYERNNKGVLEKFPHIGGVIIADDVEIGSNTCVDRGTLLNTIIGKGTKVDNLVHIAHNVIVGKRCVIVAQAMIGGGAKICADAWIAPAACIRDGITVGKKALVGMGAVVTKDVADRDIVIGVPAKSIKETKK